MDTLISLLIFLFGVFCLYKLIKITDREKASRIKQYQELTTNHMNELTTSIPVIIGYLIAGLISGLLLVWGLVHLLKIIFEANYKEPKTVDFSEEEILIDKTYYPDHGELER